MKKGDPELWDFLIEALDGIIEWVGSFISSLFGTPVENDLVAGSLNALMPLVAIPVACAVIFLAIKVVKKISWGY